MTTLIFLACSIVNYKCRRISYTEIWSKFNVEGVIVVSFHKVFKVIQRLISKKSTFGILTAVEPPNKRHNVIGFVHYREDSLRMSSLNSQRLYYCGKI